MWRERLYSLDLEKMCVGVEPELLKLLSWGALLTGVGWGRGAHSCLHVLQTQRWALPDQQQTSLLPCNLAFLAAGGRLFVQA